jgi:hypothetical protein
VPQLRERRIRLRQHERVQLGIPPRVQFGGTAGARLLDERLATMRAPAPAIDRAQIDAEQTRRFTRWLPDVTGRH